MKRKFSFLFLTSLLIVALGQPARIGWLGAVAAVIGYALFFTGVPAEFTARKRFAVATLWFTLVQLVQLSWMTSIDYQGYYILLVYFLLALGMGLQFGILSFFVPKEGKLPLSRMLFCAALWTVMEWARLFPFCGSSWNPVGLSLAHFTPSLQFSSLFGVFGLSFWVILNNLAALNVLRARKIVLAAVLACTPYLFGVAHLGYWDRHEGIALDAALVQTALLPAEKAPHPGRLNEFISPFEQWRRILSAFQKQGRAKWDLIVLPEAFVPLQSDVAYYPFHAVKDLLIRQFGPEVERAFPPQVAPYGQEQLYNGEKIACVSNLFWCQTLANHFEAELVAGLDHTDRTTGKSYNAAFYLHPAGLSAQRYDKQVLLPLAEYLPFEFLKPLTKSYGIFEFYSHGEGAQVFGDKIYFSPSICYEETFSDVMRQGRVKGAELFINVTNDNYYPHSSLHEQHLHHARLRAVENGVPLVRACNSGASAAIDGFGRILSYEKPADGQLKILNSRIVKRHHQTLFSFWGNAGIIALSSMILFTCLRRPVKTFEG
ncbi:MAG: apolipoprotein N-acyltransferase [Candidatus Melainabacteria bacterium]|nr:apolipoprotein N-acyltransferase [Candidatus Melainabacteria bacterium]